MLWEIITDEVVSANNVITSGNLDVELYYQVNGQSDWTKVNANTNVFKTNALWEPGYTEVVKLKVVNEGNLALKYQLGVNVASEVGSVNVKGENFNLSDYIKAGVVEGDQAYTRDQAVAAVDATAFTLKAGYASDSVALLPKTADNSDNEDIVTMVVYMPTTVGNEANHAKDAAAPEIKLGVKLTATQATVESDSFGTDYDKYALLAAKPWDGVTVETPVNENNVYHITTAAQLVGMMEDSKYPNCNKYQRVVLDADIDLSGKEIPGFGDGSGFFDGIFDGQGHTISNFTIDATDRTYYAGLFNQVSQYSGENTVIKNLTVANATISGSGQVGAIVGGMNGNTVVDNCKVIDCTLIGVKKVGAVVGYTAGGGTVTNNYAEKCSVFYSEKEGSEILGYENTGSTVSNNTFKDVTVKNITAISTADGLKNALTNSGNYILMNNLSMDADDTITVPAGKNVTLDLNGKTISSTSDKTSGNVEQFLVKGNLTVVGGTMTISTSVNQGWGSMSTVFDITAGGVLNLEGVTVKNLGGTDMAFCIHMNNWGEVTLNMEDSVLESPYVALRVFNSGHDMNNVTIKNSKLTANSYAFWVHNFTAADHGTQEKANTQAALLNLDMFGTEDGNTFVSLAKPNSLRYGMTNAIYADPADVVANGYPSL